MIRAIDQKSGKTFGSQPPGCGIRHSFHLFCERPAIRRHRVRWRKSRNQKWRRLCRLCLAKMKRRDALKLIAATGLAGCATPSLVQRDLIQRENAREGTRDWLLTKARIDPATKYRCPWIEGYCSRTSVRAGDSIDFFVSTNPASPFRIDIYRMGFYGGAGGRYVATLGPFKGVVQPEPESGAAFARMQMGSLRIVEYSA